MRVRACVRVSPDSFTGSSTTSMVYEGLRWVEDDDEDGRRLCLLDLVAPSPVAECDLVRFRLEAVVCFPFPVPFSCTCEGGSTCIFK